MKSKVDTENKTVTSRFLWGKSTAVYREGFGATLLCEKTVDEIKATEFPYISAGYRGDTIPWPMGDIIQDSITGIDRDALDEISNKLIN